MWLWVVVGLVVWCVLSLLLGFIWAMGRSRGWFDIVPRGEPPEGD